MVGQFHDTYNWENISFLPMAKEVSDAIRETYNVGEDSSQIFEFKTCLRGINQGREVINYYMEFLNFC